MARCSCWLPIGRSTGCVWLGSNPGQRSPSLHVAHSLSAARRSRSEKCAGRNSNTLISSLIPDLGSVRLGHIDNVEVFIHRQLYFITLVLDRDANQGWVLRDKFLFMLCLEV